MSSKFSKKLATFRIFSPRDAIEVNSEKTKRKILENNEYLVPRPFTIYFISSIVLIMKNIHPTFQLRTRED